MSKPIYVGCASLDLSNLTMLQFHYNGTENHAKHQYTLPLVVLIALCMVLNVQIFMNGLKKTSNIMIYQIKREDMNDNAHKKKLRCTKHALNGYVMSDMIGLNPKSCAFKYQHIEQKQEQGVSNAVVDTSITPYEYNNTLNTNEP